MTEQTQEPIDNTGAPDEIDLLHLQLEAIQKVHADKLRAIQVEHGAKLDRRDFIAARKHLTELTEEASKQIVAEIKETQEATRRNLALALGEQGGTETERQAFARAVELVEAAGNDVKKIEPLIHRALRYSESALARVLIMRWGGVPEYKNMHAVLSKVDPVVAKLYAYEQRWGSYAKPGAPAQAWSGWVSYKQNGEIPDIPGRDPSKQPAFLREQKRLQWEQRRAGNTNK